MRKRLMTCICLALIVCTIGASQVYAAAGSVLRGKTLGERPEGIPDAANVFHWELTDEQKARMEDVRIQREEKLNAFINSLSSEQKSLYDAMMPAKPIEGQQRSKPGDAAMNEIKQKQEAFLASLSESQKAVYEELFAKPHNKELSDEQKSQMEYGRKQHEEKLNLFINSLNSDQKVLYEAMLPTKLVEGQQRAKPDDAIMEGLKQRREAFIDSLSESQKTEYEELFAKQFHPFGNLGDSNGVDKGANGRNSM